MSRSLLPRDLELRQRYKLLIQGIAPRPIALVSTLSPEGRPNLAPFSFFSGVGGEPMSLLFCPANDAEGAEKDTLRNCKPKSEGGRGEFVVNVALDAYIHRVVASAEPLPPGESEFELAVLKEEASTVVAPPRVARSPLAFECETQQVIRMHPGAPSGGNVVIGRVVCIHLEDGLMDENFTLDPKRLDFVGRMGGFDYCRTRDRFSLKPGRAALDELKRLD
jgi:flavin reductase (DIM6/NTAB) family NADH-FMN oxidoreductase RutF